MRLLRLAYLIAQHPFHLHRWLVKRGLAQGWIDDFRPFWDTVRPPSLPISDYASYTWLEYFFTQRARERYPEGDHFEDRDWQYARLLSYVKRREMHPLRMIRAAWALRGCRHILEFGSGSAPYARFIRTAWPLDQHVTVCDVPGFMLEYAKTQGDAWALTNDTASQPLGVYDGIVCTEVFEHLRWPISTARWMMDSAEVIAFDYVEDGSELRELTIREFRVRGSLNGPDARGLYVWRRP